MILGGETTVGLQWQIAQRTWAKRIRQLTKISCLSPQIPKKVLVSRFSRLRKLEVALDPPVGLHWSNPEAPAAMMGTRWSTNLRQFFFWLLIVGLCWWSKGFQTMVNLWPLCVNWVERMYTVSCVYATVACVTRVSHCCQS